jgi:hypothetical protein
MQIVDPGDTIERVIEEYDLTRVVHLDQSDAPEGT